MKVLAIDPGLSTGMTYVSESGDLLDSYLATDPAEVLARIVELQGSDYTVVVEDFVGAGPRTREAIFVLKLIGGITAACFLDEIKCVLQVPQQRLPLLNEAKRRVPKGTIIHIIDSYAHALAYVERSTGVLQDRFSAQDSA